MAVFDRLTRKVYIVQTIDLYIKSAFQTEDDLFWFFYFIIICYVMGLFVYSTYIFDGKQTKRSLLQPFSETNVLEQ